MRIFVDTCVLPRSQMETARIYRDRFGSSLGFELLPMFDLPDFEANLKENVRLFQAGPLVFHEPVWGVEHSAPRGSRAYEEGMYHIRKTMHWAKLLRPESMVFHLNNCPVPEGEKDQMLKTALENLEEMRELFPEQKILLENTGTRWDHTALLDQAEFTELCRGGHLPVLIDVGHANANGWDIRKLILDLKDQICGFHLHNNDGVHDLHNRLKDGTLDIDTLIPWIIHTLPDVSMVVEYTRPVFHGEPLISDIQYLKNIEAAVSAAPLPEVCPEETIENLTCFDPKQIACVFNNMDDAVCVTGKGGELLFANPAARLLFGFDSRRHMKIWDAIPYVEGNDALIQLFIDSIMEKRKTVSSLVDYVRNDGSTARLHVSLTCESDEANILLIVISDLTRLVTVQSAFARYTSPEIADYVLNTPEGARRGGQSREVSILMSDLRGFTAISTRIPSADLIHMLNNYFEQMAAVVQQCHGTIIEFLGDGIFVVFGAPDDLPDHAELAVRCAIEMQKRMVAVNEWNLRQDLPELEMGIGIHSGRVIVGNIGSDKKMKYGCIGEAVNMTGRIESLTVGGQILLSEHTKDLIGEALVTDNEKTMIPKGGKAPIKIYDVVRLGDVAVPAVKPIEWLPLSGDQELTFYRLAGKTVETAPCKGRMLQISADEKNGLLTTEASLEPLTNLMLRVDACDVYAKVLRREDSGYLLRFTMKPRALSGLFH